MKRRSFFGMIAAAIVGGDAMPPMATGGFIRSEAILPLRRDWAQGLVLTMPPEVERERFWRAYFREQRRAARGEATGLLKCLKGSPFDPWSTAPPADQDAAEDTRGHA